MKYRILGFAAGLSLLVGAGESAALEVTWLDSRHLDTTVDRTSRLEVSRSSVEEQIPGHFLLVYKLTNVTGDVVRREQVVVDVLPSNSGACLAPLADSNTCPLEPRRTEFRDANPASPPASDDLCLWTYEFTIPAGVQIEPMLVYAVTEGQGVEVASASAQIDVGDAGVHPLYWSRATAGASDTRALMMGINLDRARDLSLITREGEPLPLDILAATQSQIEFELPAAALSTECCFALRTSDGEIVSLALSDSTESESQTPPEAQLAPVVVVALSREVSSGLAPVTGTDQDVLPLLPSALRASLEAVGVERMTRAFPLQSAPGGVGRNALGEPTRLEDVSNVFVGHFGNDAIITSDLALLSENPTVQFAQLEQPVAMAAYIPNDPLFSDQWYLSPQDPTECGKSVLISIGAETAWNKTRGADTDTVAILDSGLDIRHEEFAGHYGLGEGFVPPYYSAVDTTNNSSKHGTATAGIVAARADNSLGISGVAPLSIPLSVGVFRSDLYGLPIHLAQGIDWTRERRTPILSMSVAFGSFPYPAYPPPPNPEDYIQSPYLNAICRNAFYSGQLLIAAVGNEDDNQRMWPAGYDKPVLAVGAVTSDGERWSDLDYWGLSGSGSNYGRWIDLVAPGGALMLAPKLGPSQYYDLSNCNLEGGSFFTGTSSAVPVVAGVSSLLHSLDPDLLGEDIGQILLRTTVDVGAAGFDTLTGMGVVNAANAVQYLSPESKALVHAGAGLAPADAPLAEIGRTEDVSRRLLGFPGYPADTTVVVDIVHLRGWIPYSAGYTASPDVWARSSGTLGLRDTTIYNYEYEVMTGSILPGTVTATGCSVTTSLMILPDLRWYPVSRDSARVAITALGASSVTSVDPMAGDPREIRAVSPNPFRGGALRVRFGSATGGWKLRIIDARGRHVRLLGRGSVPISDGVVTWDRTDDRGVRVGSGVYFIALSGPEVGARDDARRVVVLP